MSLSRDRSAKATSNTRRLARTALLAALALAHPHASYADAPAPEAHASERRVVVLDAVGGDGIDADFEATLGELLGRLQLGLVRSEGASGARVLARVRIESNERGATLTVESGRSDVPTVRREVERGDSPALFRETLAHVILGAIEPLVGREPEVDRPPPPPPSAPVANAPPPTGDERPSTQPPANQEPREPMQLSVGARAGPRLLESDRAGISFAGTVSLTLPARLRPSAAVYAGYVLPARVSRSSVDAEFHLVPVRAEARIQPLRWGGGGLETALVGGVDFVSLAPQSAPSYVHLDEPQNRVQPVLGAAMSGRFRLSPSSDFVVTAGLDVDTSPRRWVVATGRERDELFETARFRPYAALGLDFTMLGVPPAPSHESSP
jgi:hypothetical protein